MNLRTEEKEKIEHVLFILDKSGSMERLKDQMLDGMNEQIQELRKTGGAIKTYVSFVTFDSTVNVVRWNVPLEEFDDIKREEYVPDGMTAMLDAVGQSICRLRNETKNSVEDVSHLVVIISDGAENSSGEYGWQSVADIINEVKNDHWTVTYMGANQDLSVISAQLGIAKGNITLWNTTLDGTSLAYTNMSGSLSNYRDSRVMFCSAAMDNSNFYSAINTPQTTDSTTPTT